MNESGNRGSGSERGSIEPRRRQGISNLLDWDPFRGFFPGNWQQMFGIDVNRRDDNYEIEMPVPGFKPQDIDITYQDGVITVAGRNERRSLTRMLSVPEDVDEDSIQANVENGILMITMRQHPKKDQHRHERRNEPNEYGDNDNRNDDRYDANGRNRQLNEPRFQLATRGGAEG